MRVHSVYVALGLNLRRKAKHGVPARNPEPPAVPEEANESSSMDFMSKALKNVHRFGTFNVIYYYNCEAFAIGIDLSLLAASVTRVLDRLVGQHGYPKAGKPTQNSYVERFNRINRGEILNTCTFHSLDEVSELTRTRIEHYILVAVEYRRYSAPVRTPPRMLSRRR